MFATFTDPTAHRGTQILVADTPQGPFVPWSEREVTPRTWQCLDGTLHVDEAGDPWIVYCHEFTQIHDGAVYAQRLRDDLRDTAGPPVLLFNASDAPWSKPLREVSGASPAYVTDGSFLFRLKSGHLIMLWPSYGDQGDAMGIAHSASDTITGPWGQEEKALWPANGGHGMILRLGTGDLVLTLHTPSTKALSAVHLCHRPRRLPGGRLEHAAASGRVRLLAVRPGDAVGDLPQQRESHRNGS